MNRTPFKMRGLTLLELMIAMTLGLIMIGGFITVFQSNRITMRAQEGLTQVQENGRIAMSILSKDIRNTGNFGCATQLVKLNNLINLSDNNGHEYLWDINLDKSIDGFEYASDAWSPSLETFISGKSPKTHSDILALRLIETCDASVVSDDAANGKTKLKAAGCIDEDDIVLASNCENAVLFQASEITTTGDITTITRELSSDGDEAPGNSTISLGTTSIDSDYQAAVMRSRIYYVGTGTTGPSLIRLVRQNNGNIVAEELVEGIESMQVSYGIDTTADRVADSYVTANSVGTGSVVSARISLLVRSINSISTDKLVRSPLTAPAIQIRPMLT